MDNSQFKQTVKVRLSFFENTSKLTFFSADSLKAAAKSAADAIMSMYVGNEPGQVPGIFLPVDVYYWWLGGANWNVQPSLDPR
jgi:hypothetical protein